MKRQFFLGAALLTLSACSDKLEISNSQAATISPDARKFIEQSKVTHIPSWFPITDKDIIKGRKKFNAAEAMKEDEMIKFFHLHVDSLRIADVPVLLIRPENPDPVYKDVVGFNVHGGGFIIGTARDRSALLMAGRLGIPVYSVDYACAPEAKYPIAINQCLSVHSELIKQVNPNKMLAISSSAGGEIMVSMIQRASEEKLPLMKMQVLFTPGVDLTGNGDSGAGNDGRDVVSLKMTVRSVHDFYLGGADAKDPHVSPIYAPLPENFPATVITTGTRDLLESNAVRFFWKLQAAEIPSELLVQEGMWHGFQWEWNLPETDMTMKAVARFVKGQLSK